MINNRELRIGNYIFVDDIRRKICCIKNDDDTLQSPCIGFEQNSDCEYEIVDSDRVRAIPISDELLRDLGFVFHDYFKLWQRKQPKKAYTIELDSEYSALDFSHRPIVRDMEYLHQLQNLFFSVQGEELFFLDGNAGPGRSYTLPVQEMNETNER